MAKSRCVICGSTKDVEQNHVGGRNHIAWFTMPFCRPHHDQFHALARAAGIELRYTSDPIDRAVRVQKLLLIVHCMILEYIQRAKNRKVLKKAKANTTRSR